MASQQTTVDHLVDQMQAAGHVTAKKMFGEYGLYCDGKIVALVCDDLLFVKPTAVARTRTAGFDEAPPYPGAKPSIVIPTDKWEDREWLSELIRASAAELPPPKEKRPKQ